MKCSVHRDRDINARTTSNDVWVKSKFVLSVMLQPLLDLDMAAIPLIRNRDWRGSDIVNNPLCDNSTIFALSPCALSHVSLTNKRSMPFCLIYVDISLRLQAISLPISDCALNDATMNRCAFCFIPYTSRLDRWRCGRWYSVFKSLVQ